MTRHLAIGDIHGCITALTSLVDFVAPNSDDTIVTLGDYVDRGPNSRAVLAYLIGLAETHNVKPLRGNHEIMLLDSREKTSWFEAWINYGGWETLLSYAPESGGTGTFDDIPDSHIDFLENRLLPYHECETHFFVHANADSNVVLSAQSDSTRYWRKFDNPQPHCSGKVMVCGHTQQKSGVPLNLGNAICIDTWAFGDGWLSCIDVATGKIWQANEAAETRSFMIDELDGRCG